MNIENNVLSDIVGERCPICDRERTYKSQRNADKGKGKPCRSCANSLKKGGEGWTPICRDCGVRPREVNSQCRECHNLRSKKYHTEIYRWSRYGLSGPIEMKCCEVCSIEIDLVIDHCHDTGNFRGVLCRQCNAAIGLLKENKENIKKLLEYSERTFSAN